MSARRVAIVGSGMIGSTLALPLAEAGFEVTVFEKGPEYPYPHRRPFEEAIRYDWMNPAWSTPPDVGLVVNSGSYPRELAQIGRAHV